jgi:hypothetical protein
LGQARLWGCLFEPSSSLSNTQLERLGLNDILNKIELGYTFHNSALNTFYTRDSKYSIVILLSFYCANVKMPISSWIFIIFLIKTDENCHISSVKWEWDMSWICNITQSIKILVSQELVMNFGICMMDSD